MARPTKQTADYFPHDADASSGATITILTHKFGNDGYAAWFRLLELLARTPGHVFDCRNPGRWEFLQAITHLDGQKAENVFAELSTLEAIDPQLWAERVIWSQHLVDRLADVYKNRRAEIPQKPVISCRNPTAAVVSTPDNPSAAPISTTENTQSKVKEIKGNNIPAPAKTAFGEFHNVLLTCEEYQKLSDRFGDELNAKIEALSEGIASKGYKYKSHYATLLSWERMHGPRGMGIGKETFGISSAVRSAVPSDAWPRH